jgi:hydrogenase maturation protein HypF
VVVFTVRDNHPTNLSSFLKKANLLKKQAIEATFFGIVQGVGFRPFLYRLAHQYQYKGWVKNIGFGVKLHLETLNPSSHHHFFKNLLENLPPLAQIERIEFSAAHLENCSEFSIHPSQGGESFVFISPDISVCPNCLQEMYDSQDRRYQYPFINCTDCGPRYTIVKQLPYDRPQTTMSEFIMCPACREEYENPLDRRYHAQPIACPECGPHIELLEAGTRSPIQGGIKKAAQLIQKGYIVAVKGLGGFHLIANPFNQSAVQRLRKIKQRKRKPFALMARSLEIIDQYAYLTPIERNWLLSPRRPIVLLRKKQDIPGIAPYLKEIGFMLPYTPLHYLILDELKLVIATSSNRKDAPIMKDEQEIDSLCDFILTHNRPIHMRADDSVLKIVNEQPLFFRRARGFVPYPQPVPQLLDIPTQIIALGGELKDTISVFKQGYVITSQFLGDLDDYQNFGYFEETLHHLQKLFTINPHLLVTDLHPHFHTTRYAEKQQIPHLKVQHHFAHLLAPLLEHGYGSNEIALGVAWDGFGLGDDGRAWGGEFFLFNYSSYTRLAHFQEVPLPGGDLAARQPWRMALAHLITYFGPNFPSTPALQLISSKEKALLLQMITHHLNAPPTSSCGRLFDAIAFLSEIAPPEIEFEAEAPMRLEALAEEKITNSAYPYWIDKKKIPWIIQFKPLFEGLLKDIKKGKEGHYISTKFHHTLVQLIGEIAEEARRQFQVQTVVLSGGVFLNSFLLERVENLLQEKGFQILRPQLYSPNDESLSLGQIAFGLNYLRQKSSGEKQMEK